MCRVPWSQQVSHGEQEQPQLDNTANRVILVGALDITEKDRGAGDLLETSRELFGGLIEERVCLVDIHYGGIGCGAFWESFVGGGGVCVFEI